MALWEADKPIDLARAEIIAANAYIGAFPIAGALARGAQVVVTGRVADPSLALGPLVHHFGWREDDWDLLAAGTLVGHLLECGAQVTGGYFRSEEHTSGLQSLMRTSYTVFCLKKQIHQLSAKT